VNLVVSFHIQGPHIFVGILSYFVAWLAPLGDTISDFVDSDIHIHFI
jgi:hypothetical protein